MKTYKDKNGNELKIGMEVSVPYPNGNDIHNAEFNGIINSVRNDCVIVEDSEGYCFSIEANRLEIYDENESKQAVENYLKVRSN